MTSRRKVGSPNFRKIKKLTHGMLSAKVYKEIYNHVKEAKDGNMMDVGTGRGATSISIALGIKHSNKRAKLFCIDQFYQHVAKHPHKYTMKTNPDDCIELNIQIFKDNIQQYGVDDIITILTGKTTEVSDKFSQSREYSLLSIDVDGYIDRDFKLFYNRLLPGATIIIDDYANVINHHGKKFIEEYKRLGKDERKRYIEEKNGFFLGRILGKHYLIFLLVEYFIKQGLLERKKVVDETFFGTKPENVTGNVEFNEQDLLNIRKRILDEFFLKTS